MPRGKQARKLKTKQGDEPKRGKFAPFWYSARGNGMKAGTSGGAADAMRQANLPNHCDMNGAECGLGARDQPAARHSWEVG